MKRAPSHYSDLGAPTKCDDCGKLHHGGYGRIRPELCFRCYMAAIADGRGDEDLPLFAPRDDGGAT